MSTAATQTALSFFFLPLLSLPPPPLSLFLPVAHSIASSTGHCIFHGTAAITGHRGECKEEKKGSLVSFFFSFHCYHHHHHRRRRHSCPFNWPILKHWHPSTLFIQVTIAFSILSLLPPRVPLLANCLAFLLPSSSPWSLSIIDGAIILCHSLSLRVHQMEKNKLKRRRTEKKKKKEKNCVRLWGGERSSLMQGQLTTDTSYIEAERERERVKNGKWVKRQRCKDKTTVDADVQCILTQTTHPTHETRV